MIEARRFRAEGRALAADLYARFHLAEPLAIRRAYLADVGAQGADAVVELALVREQIGGRGTDHRAVQHQPDVLRPRVLAAELKAMRHHHGQAGRMAARERLHGRVHLPAEPVGNVHHPN